MNEATTIQVEPTPNPDVLKFLLGRTISSGRIFDFPSRSDHQDESPLVERLFQETGVQGIMLGSDFISVTRETGLAWSDLKPRVLGAIMTHLQSGEPILQESVRHDVLPDSPLEDDETTLKIKELLEMRVRPAVAMDGGDIEFHGFDQGIVYVTLRGACAGCPSATVTLKMGIENMLRHYIPEVSEVRTVA